ncbi:hypothetical protein N7466_005969 [Penicillium verhagenii]|uniref:uncharacterized protein n=1 Tax=Penicillium verhagenii TaxID=1562060 RepID=UPI002545797C|nr:uncharacterized protein N7466_005969 [Penicillium verhagenii]KAJ5930476.1 hypothetical protein N7466_005969 [Penicillium verhagenii]
MPLNVEPQEYFDGLGDESGRDQMCLPTAIRALNTLMANGFMVVEYGNQILFRHGDRKFCEVSKLISEIESYHQLNMDQNPEWLLRDEDVIRASELLARDYPRVRPNERPWVGYWDSRARCHSIEMPELGLNFGVIYLLPMSTVRLHVNDTVRVASTLNKFHTIHSPEPVAYIASLIQELLTLRVADMGRFRVQSDLLHFICFRVLRIPPSPGPGIVQRSAEQRKKMTAMAFATNRWPWRKMDPTVRQIAKKIIGEPQYVWDLAPSPPGPPVMLGPPNHYPSFGSFAGPVPPTMPYFPASVIGPGPVPRVLLSAPPPSRLAQPVPPAVAASFGAINYMAPPPFNQFATTPQQTLHTAPVGPASVGPAPSPGQFASPAPAAQSSSSRAMPAPPSPPA